MTDRDDANLIPPDKNEGMEKYGSTEESAVKVAIEKSPKSGDECFFKDGKRKIGENFYLLSLLFF